jgi:hypothetical protein
LPDMRNCQHVQPRRENVRGDDQRQNRVAV